MQLMILVDDAGGLIPALNHSPWNGLTIADFVMPFFLFIVGVALAFTYKVIMQSICFYHLNRTRIFIQTFLINCSFNTTNMFLRQKPSCKVDATRKAILRALKLLALGIFLQGNHYCSVVYNLVQVLSNSNVPYRNLNKR
jgi:heparan-alpha-glucosaminide N-acetyltransferase